MKYPVDNVTADLPLSLPRRRGRPATGEAMTPAQRKRAQRARDRAASMTDDYTTCTNERLLRELGFAVTHGLCYLSQAIARELQARAQSVYDLKAEKARQDREPVTVTKTNPLYCRSSKSVTVTENAGNDLDDSGAPAPSAPVELAKPAPVKRVKPAPVKRAKPAPKYRHATTGETWSGRGMAPKWVQVYVARGGLLDDLLL